MFGGLWYRAKVVKILLDEFGYSPNGPGGRAKVFKAVAKHIRSQGGNEYDGAIAFMLVQINSLSSSPDEDAKEWASRMSDIAYSLMPLSLLGRDLMEKS